MKELPGNEIIKEETTIKPRGRGAEHSFTRLTMMQFLGVFCLVEKLEESWCKLKREH